MESPATKWQTKAPVKATGSLRPASLGDVSWESMMKLTAFRDKDRTHLRDLIEVGLIDETWLSRLPPELAARLQGLLETPEG